MSKIERFPILDFSGGVRRDKSPFEMKKNELLDARNVLVDEKGRLIVRRGSYQIGHTSSGNIENSFVFVRNVAGSAPTVVFIQNNNASTAVLRYLRGSRLTTAITSVSTTVVVVDSNQFTASGTVEIEGDLIAYTGVDVNTLTGVTGIASSHAAGAAVHQWVTLTQSGTALNGTRGIYYAVLNNILFMDGYGGNWKQIANDDGTTITDVTGEPGGLFLTNYRDRLYCIGDGSSGPDNSDPRTVAFSARGNGTSWTSTDFFVAEDQRGEYGTGLKVLNDRLWIFKINSLFSYDEVELKQRQAHIGAWNHKVIQEINGIMYTFCPEGIFATNGLEIKQIGDPVRQYWKNFQPVFDSTSNRVIINTFAGKYEHHYILYIEDVTDPDTTNDIVLDYDTVKKAWTVQTGNATNFFHFASFDRFRFGDTPNQFRSALFGGDSSGKYYRFFESRYIDGQSPSVRQGVDVFEDLLSDTGSPISAMIETPLYDLTHPELYKIFKNFRGYAERGIWHVEYRVEFKGTISAYRSLGTVDRAMKVLPFPVEAEGTRIGFRITNALTAHSGIFNGFILEDTEVRKRYG